jgi:hypothetical protein
VSRQPGLPVDRDILKTVIRHTGADFGVYGSAESAATVRLGDRVAGGTTATPTTAGRG